MSTVAAILSGTASAAALHPLPPFQMSPLQLRRLDIAVGNEEVASISLLSGLEELVLRFQSYQNPNMSLLERLHNLYSFKFIQEDPRARIQLDAFSFLKLIGTKRLRKVLWEAGRGDTWLSMLLASRGRCCSAELVDSALLPAYTAAYFNPGRADGCSPGGGPGEARYAWAHGGIPSLAESMGAGLEACCGRSLVHACLHAADSTLTFLHKAAIDQLSLVLSVPDDAAGTVSHIYRVRWVSVGCNCGYLQRLLLSRKTYAVHYCFC